MTIDREVPKCEFCGKEIAKEKYKNAKFRKGDTFLGWNYYDCDCEGAKNRTIMKKQEINIDLGSGGEFKISVEKLYIEESDFFNVPVLNITGSMQGHTMGKMQVRMTPDRLKQLGEFLILEGENAKKYYNNPTENDGWGGMARSKFRKNNI